MSNYSPQQYHQQKQFIFGPVIVYTGNFLLAKEAYATILRDDLLCDGGGKILLNTGQEIRWQNLAAISLH